MFSTTNLFKKITCPEGPSCRLPNCIFSHDFDPTHTQIQDVRTGNEQFGFEDRTHIKRRKIQDGVETASTADKAIAPSQSSSKIFTGLTSCDRLSVPNQATSDTNEGPDSYDDGLQTAKRDISPPPTRRVHAAKASYPNGKPAIPGKLIILNPRLLAHNPVGHDKRRLYLVKLHENLVRLNNLVVKSKDASHKRFVRTDNELKQLALDEEERFALDNPPVYPNLIKQRMVAYSRMSLEDWLDSQRALMSVAEPDQTKVEDPFPPYNSKLTSEEELLILPHLVAHQAPLVHHGYVPNQISEEQITKVREGLTTADYWENCDLCDSRFQAFPDRREADGALTTRGPCIHHPAKAQFPSRDPTNRSKAPREKQYACCGKSEGTSGCTTNLTHVFVVKESARLASILPFEETPTRTETNENVKQAQKPAALAFDCEMGYTVHGLELIRLTATEWQTGRELLDVLVHPLGAILDFNSRYSGVWPKDFESAVPYDGPTPPPPIISDSKKKVLHIVPSPQAARRLLTSLLTPTTPVIGHALENDLKTVRLIHPTIVDTVLLFPHPKGLPLRTSLRELAKRHLGWKIQKGGKAGAANESNEGGHDSKEDAMAAGELVRVAVERKWKKLKEKGWEIKDGKLEPSHGESTSDTVKL